MGGLFILSVGSRESTAECLVVRLAKPPGRQSAVFPGTQSVYCSAQLLPWGWTPGLAPLLSSYFPLSVHPEMSNYAVEAHGGEASKQRENLASPLQLSEKVISAPLQFKAHGLKSRV